MPWLSGWIAVLGLFFATGIAAQDVGLALMLLVDDSGSINDTEFNLQYTGYINAFRSDAVWDAIQAGEEGSIAVNFGFWSSEGRQQSETGWTVLATQQDAFDFADFLDDRYNISNSSSVNRTDRPFGNRTGIGDALVWGTDQFSGLGSINANRWVMDISGDGCDNEGTRINGTRYNSFTAAAAGRDYAQANGVDAINGLVVQPTNACGFGFPEDNVLEHYQAQVALNGFVNSVDDFDAFGSAIQDKIIEEVSVSVPEPGTLTLLASGLFLFGVVGVRRGSKGTAEA